MKAKTLIDSFIYAFQGFLYSFKTQRNFRIHCLGAVVVLALVFYLDFALWEILFLLSAMFAVMVSELINTAIEKTIDLYTSTFHPLAAIAKNCAAAAVLLSSLYALLVGVILLLPRVLEF